MLFEGSEKKAELVIKADQLCLLTDVDDEFWSTLVSCSNATILSSIENDSCKAFLLSESSLFVWADRLLIITCGITQLVKSVEYFLQQIGQDKIAHLIYQRKNEFFSHAQPSSFAEDINVLTQYLAGKAFRFGELDSHHNYIFHQDNSYLASPSDRTYEFLAYQISEQASNKLTTVGLHAADIRAFLQLDTLLPNFIFDDFVFQPFGYSLNAINAHHYFTIHVTPQAHSSYVSVESNLNLLPLVPRLLSILAPASFDLMSFNEFEFETLLAAYIPENYVSKARVQQSLANNYLVSFANYILPQLEFSPASVFELRS